MGNKILKQKLFNKIHVTKYHIQHIHTHILYMYGHGHINTHTHAQNKTIHRNKLFKFNYQQFKMKKTNKINSLDVRSH